MVIDPLAHPEKIHASAFVAPGAVVVGNVTIGAEASLWFGVVVRGDFRFVHATGRLVGEHKPSATLH